MSSEAKLVVSFYFWLMELNRPDFYDTPVYCVVEIIFGIIFFGGMNC